MPSGKGTPSGSVEPEGVAHKSRVISFQPLVFVPRAFKREAQTVSVGW